MLQVPESQASGIRTGQRVDISTGSEVGTSAGVVAQVSPAPVSPEVAAEAVSSIEVGEEPVVLVTVTADPPVPPGAAVQAEIVESEQTLLAQLLGR